MSFSIDLLAARRLRARAPRTSGSPIILTAYDEHGRELGNVAVYMRDSAAAALLADGINAADGAALGLAPMDLAPLLPIEVYALDPAAYVRVQPVEDPNAVKRWARVGDPHETFSDDELAGWRSLPLRAALRLSFGIPAP